MGSYSKGMKLGSFINSMAREGKKQHKKNERDQSRCWGDNNLNHYTSSNFESSWEKKSKGDWY